MNAINMAKRGIFSVHKLFSIANREQCMAKVKALRVHPNWQNYPTRIVDPNASILVPFCSVNGVPSLLYTLRAPDASVNQIVFPGGRLVTGETVVQTALREVQEEIGLSPTKIDIWGTGPAIPGCKSKLLITPVIGAIINMKPEYLNVTTKDVTEVFAVPIELLCDERNQYHVQFDNGFILPVFVAEKYKVWGLTGYLTHIFLKCLLTPDVYNNNLKKKLELAEAGSN